MLLLMLMILMSAIAGLNAAYNHGHALPVHRNIIKVRASGFLPFESDLLLPLGILRQLQHAQERASRSHHMLPYSQHQQHHHHHHQKKKKKPKQQVRLERTKSTLAGMQMYNLIDDDGELLLNLRVHNDGVKGTPNADKDTDIDRDRDKDRDTLTAAASFRHSVNDISDSPWLPSMWRPTTERVTSSSPKPLPLHQYLTSNHLSDAQRRSLKPQKDWPYK